MPKLKQIIAIDKGTKSRVYARLSEIYKTIQKPALFNGLARTYKPLDDDGEQYPDESKRVQFRVIDLLDEIAEGMTEYFDVAARRDYANCTATADVVVDDVVILSAVPATHLLFLEKQLNDFKAEVDKLPELSPGEEWSYDSTGSVFRGKPARTSKTKKIPKPITLAPATPEHPAQVQLGHEDVLVGYWSSTAMSGAIPTDLKRAMQRRINELMKAVRFARETANSIDVPEVSIGKPIFEFLFPKAS